MGIKIDIKKRYFEANSKEENDVKRVFTLDPSFEMKNELLCFLGLLDQEKPPFIDRILISVFHKIGFNFRE